LPPATDTSVLPLTGADDATIRRIMADEGLRLAPGEVRRMLELLKRDPTRVEATIFDTMWSEHCSYKSSRWALKAFLPTESPDVILGPGEDAGVVRLGTHAGVSYALVIAHESHNHPSQVVPVEGAATGIGGIVRDVNCMGAEVIGVLDALRFGDPEGPRASGVREIVRGVVDGIWQYGNPLGVPNLGGDVFFSDRYDENCLVNVVALGLVREDRVVRSRVPEAASREPYVLVLVGKPTDETGFGGASFASAILEQDAPEQRGHVQVPDPFLKRVLFEANRAALEWLFQQGAPFGFKDLGAGGIACASSELAAAGGFGMDVDLDLVPTPRGEYPPEVIACSETQERFALVVPERLAPKLLSIYNEDYALPGVYDGARAAVIGRVRKDPSYRILRHGQAVCDTHVEVITAGIEHRRAQRPRAATTSAAAASRPGPRSVRSPADRVPQSRLARSDRSVLRHRGAGAHGRARGGGGRVRACPRARGAARRRDHGRRQSLVRRGRSLLGRGARGVRSAAKSRGRRSASHRADRLPQFRQPRRPRGFRRVRPGGEGAGRCGARARARRRDSGPDRLGKRLLLQRVLDRPFHRAVPDRGRARRARRLLRRGELGAQAGRCLSLAHRTAAVRDGRIAGPVSPCGREGWGPSLARFRGGAPAPSGRT